VRIDTVMGMVARRCGGSRCPREGDAQGIELPGSPPLLHFSRRLDVVVWPIERVGP
jgi:hypothetical protein